MNVSKPWALLTVLLFVPAVAAGPQAGSNSEAPNEWAASGRAEMESLERRLEDAVGQVSLPHAGILLGRANASHGYRLPGYGVVLVLTPRALPGRDALFVVQGKEHRPRTDIRIERHVAHPGAEPHWEPERLEELERKVIILQHAAEARRRAAEEDMDRIVEDVRVRVEIGEGAPAPEAHDVTVHVDTPGTEPTPDAVLVREMPEPPWKFWFEAEAPEDARSPDRVVEDVRSVLIDALDAGAGAAVGLRGDEFLTVAVDFVPGDLFASHRRPTRTLIVRARQRDLEARAAGDIPPEELRRRVEVIEY
jgi:hypothetical protein